MPTENRSSNTEMVSVPEGFMLVERSIWTEQQVEAATACITRLKNVPGMRDCDLAMAAIDAAQCKAPEITLADLLPAQQHKREPVVCSHEWTDDGEFMLVCTVCGAQENHDPKWRDMATAPRDGTLVRLLVEFTEHATEDSEAIPSPTIGANSFDHTGEDLWQFAGWSWEQDCFTQGAGEPVGWLPLLDTPHADPAEFERLREGMKYESERAALCLEELQECESQRDEFYAEITGLRAQLAEAHALLARVVDSGALTSEQYESLEAECCAISASAPKCKTCQDQGEVFVRKSDVHYGMQTEPEPVMAACPDCAKPSALPDPLGCNECTHAECGRFDGPRQVECRAMADNACARPGARS